MVETVVRGPLVNIGSVLDGRVDPFDGPGLEYQSTGFPDIRFSGVNTTGITRGRVRAWLNSPFIVGCDNCPQTFSTNGLVTAAAPVAGTPMTLFSAQQAGANAGNPTMAPGVSIYRSDTNALVTGLSCLDFGFTTGTTTAGSTSVTVPDSTQFVLGQWIAIGGVGAVGNVAPLYTQVVAIPSSTAITLRDAAVTALANAPIGNAMPPVPLGAASAGVFPKAVWPFLPGGIGAYLNPVESLARCVSITGVAATAAQTIPVRGYDIYGFPMTETIAIPAGAATTYGKKAFKYIASITPTTAGGTIAVGWGDTFGIAVRSDKWEYTNNFYAGAFQTAQTGWHAFDGTNPATGTTFDVRGTLTVSANANASLAPIATPAATNGTNRLMIATSVPLYNNIQGTPINSAPMYGVTQFAG